MKDAKAIRDEIEATVLRVLQDTGRPVNALCDPDQSLEQIGLDSLDLAQVVVLLDQKYQVDPFRKPGTAVRTFSDLVRVYCECIENRSG